jgi:uncharacterized membrane protein YhhN
MSGATDPISLLLVAAALFAALYGAVFAPLPPSWSRTVVKTLAVVPLAAVAPIFGAPAGIAVGLLLGALGDAFLSRPGDRAFLFGMVAFGAGHLAYLAVILGVGDGVSLLAAVPLAALALSTEVWLQPRTGALRWPVRAYVLVIAAMAAAAFSLGPWHGVLKIGIALFVLSDLVLAVERFVLADRPPGRILPRLVWAAYWVGQVLILFGGALIS